MNSKPLLSAIPLMLLASCTTPGHPGFTMSCANDLNGHVWSGTMTPPSGATVAVTIDFTDNAPPGFKHNNKMAPPPPPDLLPEDAECYDSSSQPPSTPTTIKIYKSDTTPPLASVEAAWAVSTVVPQGFVFHLHDPGSRLFPQGADGNFI